MALENLSAAVAAVRVASEGLLSALGSVEGDIERAVRRADSLQDCIDKKNAELVEAAQRAADASDTADKAEARLASLKKALEAYKAVVNA